MHIDTDITGQHAAGRLHERHTHNKEAHMTCILKRRRRYRVKVRMDPPRGNLDLLVTTTSMSRAAAAALAAFGLGQDRLLHVEQIKRRNTP